MVSNSSARGDRAKAASAAATVDALAGCVDRGAADSIDADSIDAGSIDAGSSDAGSSDTGSSDTGSSDTTEQVLARYRISGSHRLLALVVERHRSVVESMAAGLAARLPRSVDTQDLVHAGLWGLMQAIESYEPARCDQFQAFMRIRVRGSMLDELRHMDFLPRLFRRRVRERDEVRQRLRMDLEREPTDSELASALGITEHALLRRCEPSLMRAGNSPENGEEDQFAQLADDGCESPIDAVTRQETLELIRTSLDPVEWRVLQLHYLEGLSGKQVARKLRLSASRICQIHGRVLDRLKARLSPTGS